MSSNTVVPKALNMINDALKPIIRSGRKIERMQMNVCPTSDISEHLIIQTEYGDLRINPNCYVPKGMAYIIEDSGCKGGGFAWVSRRKQA